MRSEFSKICFGLSLFLIFSAPAHAMIKKQAGAVSAKAISCSIKPKPDVKLLQAATQTAQALSNLVEALHGMAEGNGLVDQEQVVASVAAQPQIIIDSAKKGEYIDYIKMSPQPCAKLAACRDIYVFVIRFNCDVTRDVSDLFSIFMSDCLSHHKNLNNVICYSERIDHNRAIFRCFINKNPHQFRVYLDEVARTFFSIDNMKHECGCFRKRFNLAAQHGNPAINLFFR